VADRFSHIAAGQFIASYGRMAGMILRARADLATERGHTNAAATWREIADAADAVQEPATPRRGEIGGPNVIRTYPSRGFNVQRPKLLTCPRGQVHGVRDARP